MTAVIPAPTITPRKRLEVSLSKIRFILFPAAASSPELIICIPYRKSAKPPSKLKISVIFKTRLPFLIIKRRYSPYSIGIQTIPYAAILLKKPCSLARPNASSKISPLFNWFRTHYKRNWKEGQYDLRKFYRDFTRTLHSDMLPDREKHVYFS